MAKYVIDDTTLQKLADAVRTEANVTGGLSTDDMEEKIHRIPDVTIDNLFAEKSPITSIVYTGTLIRINNAFSGMPNLVSATVPNVQYLPQGTFYNCKTLKKVDLGESLYMSETMAFHGCVLLDTLILRRTDQVCRIPSGALRETLIESGTGYIYVPKVILTNYETDSTYVEMGIKFRTIEDYPEICKREEYGSGNGTESDSSFKDVIERTATNPTLPSDLTKIESNAFRDCTNLALTSLPNGVTYIGTYAFYNCSQLALTSLPSSLTAVDNYAFCNCTKLSLTSLPSQLKSLANRAFASCKGLTMLTFPSSLESISINVFNSCSGLNSVTFEGTPSSIGSSAFASCTNLTTINVPWAEGEVDNAPWGATNATINYNYTGGTT